MAVRRSHALDVVRRPMKPQHKYRSAAKRQKNVARQVVVTRLRLDLPRNRVQPATRHQNHVVMPLYAFEKVAAVLVYRVFSAWAYKRTRTATDVLLSAQVNQPPKVLARVNEVQQLQLTPFGHRHKPPHQVINRVPMLTVPKTRKFYINLHPFTPALIFTNFRPFVTVHP